LTSASDKTDFRLATLLRLRQLARDERRESLAEVQRADGELVRQLTELDVEQHGVQGECREAAAPGEVNVVRLVETHRYLVGLQACEDQLEAERESLAAEIDCRRQSLVKADQDVRVLEKLQDRRRQTRRLEEERQQAKQLDEAALQATASLTNTHGIAAFQSTCWGGSCTAIPKS
jgi:flagellar protein FliJ